MSHVVDVKLIVQDLSALDRAVTALGGRFHRDATTFRSYSTSANPCAHKITVPNAVFEVGVVPRTDTGYTLQYDGWGREGRPIEEAFGRSLSDLKDEYGAQVAEAQLQSEGWETMRARSEQGDLQVQAWRP